MQQTQTQVHRYRFYKDKTNRWYIDYPEWTGEIDELEMVCGADTMLDILSEGGNEITLSFTDQKGLLPQSINLIELNFHSFESGGAIYTLDGLMVQNGLISQGVQVWLCHVTKFIFGYLPEKQIFISK